MSQVSTSSPGSLWRGRRGTMPDHRGSVARPWGRCRGQGGEMGMRWSAAAIVTASLGLLPAQAAAARDYTRNAYNVMPPGQAGTAQPTKNSTDQLRLYDGLTPLGQDVTMRDVRRYF